MAVSIAGEDRETLKSLLQRFWGWLRRFGALDAAFVVGLALPMVVYHVVLRSIRVVRRGTTEGALMWVDAYKSDIGFHLAFAALGFAFLMFVSRRWSRVGTLLALQLAVVAITILELTGFRFFLATGSTVDFPLIWFSLSQLAETADVVSSEVPRSIWIMGGSSLAAALLLPWLVAALWRWLVKPEREPFRARYLLGIGGIAAMLAFTPPMADRSSSFVRNPVLNVATSAVQMVLDSFGDTALYEVDTRDARLAKRPGEPQKNLVVILLESTRARSVTPYNPEIETTPYLDELAKTSLLAERAYAVVPHTSKALVATLCGIEPRLRMPITEGAPGGIPGKCLAQMLRDEGYATVFLQSATQKFEDRPQLVENMGYEDFIPLEKMPRRGFAKANYFGREDNIMLEPSGKWLDQDMERPFFMTYLTLTPHHNYLAPRKYGRHDFAEDDELNRYLNSVHYLDHFVANVIDMFKKKGLYENTVFIILGDHGEGFEEHGRFQHDNVIWQEGIRVPFLVHDASRWKSGKRLEWSVNQLDVMPTALDLLGYDLADATIPGASVRTLDRHRTLHAQCWYERRCMASIHGDEKFIHHFDQQPDEFYDLGADPHETNDLAAQTKDLDRRRNELLLWRRRVNSMHDAHNKKTIEQYVSDEPPQVGTPLDAQFGPWVKLIGAELPPGPLHPGDTIELTYHLQVLEKLPSGWRMFVHGKSTSGARRKSLTHPPVGGLYPVEDWRPGDYISDKHSVTIPRSSKGDFTIYLGFYHPDKDPDRAEVTGTTPVDERRAQVAVLPLTPKPTATKIPTTKTLPPPQR